ncbi:MAG: N-glycosylase/DNA lyase [Elusimicrobiota bacterium]
MKNYLDLEKGKKIASILLSDYSQKRGVFKEFPFPPEYLLPKGIEKGSDEQLLFLTLTVSLDYMRDSKKLWKQSYDAWFDPGAKWIFNPKIVIQNKLTSLVKLFEKINDQRPRRDAKIWFTISKKILEFSESIYNLIEYFDFDAIKISEYIQNNRRDFPYLGGPKIKPLWLRMINDTAGIKLKKVEKIPIPVDVHTARATFKLIFNENFNGQVTDEIREKIQNTWKDILKGSKIFPLQLDEPLWLLGKHKLLEKFTKEHNF